MGNFLMVYDRAKGDVLRLDRFPNQEAAMRQRFALERSNKDNPDIEIVVFVADSEDELRRTHARYFKSFSDLVRGFSLRVA
ncbi:hypothetical protein DLJ58_21245 [Micromonospora arida]|uniref:Uncharacterized protein n=1 Tax=Micromonospora arida TaxID=2203715 RepID=A0A3N9X392_9ACTN|nr:hypothetical protein DLJ58_21245 [Micromonospora arida]